MGIGEDIMHSYCLDCDHLGRDHNPLEGCNVEDCQCSMFTINPNKKLKDDNKPDKVLDDI